MGSQMASAATNLPYPSSGSYCPRGPILTAVLHLHLLLETCALWKKTDMESNLQCRSLERPRENSECPRFFPCLSFFLGLQGKSKALCEVCDALSDAFVLSWSMESLSSWQWISVCLSLFCSETHFPPGETCFSFLIKPPIHISTVPVCLTFLFLKAFPNT